MCFHIALWSLPGPANKLKFRIRPITEMFDHSCFSGYISGQYSEFLPLALVIFMYKRNNTFKKFESTPSN